MPTCTLIRIKDGQKKIILAVIDESIRSSVLANPRENIERIKSATDAAGFTDPVALAWIADGEVEFFAPPEWQSFLAKLKPEQMPEMNAGEIIWSLA